MSAPFHVNLTFRPQHIRVDRLMGPSSQPPEDPSGEQDKSITITAGDLLTLVCTAGPANPPVPLQWRQILCDENAVQNHTNIFGGSSSRSNKPPCNVINNFGESVL